MGSANLVPTLLTYEGYFPEGTLYVEMWAKPEEVAVELRAQIEKALQAGIKPTHIDNHMATVYGLMTGNDFLDIIFDLSKQYALPFRLPRNLPEYYENQLPPERIAKLLGLADSLVNEGFVLPDYLYSVGHGSTYEESFSNYRHFLMNLKPGVTELYIHSANESDEIKAITNAWRDRDFDYRIFMSTEMKNLIDSLGIHLIGWRDLQQLQIEQIGTTVNNTQAAANFSDFGLFQNYPNPFNSSTFIQYSIPRNLMVQLRIYNVQGGEVKTLINEIQRAGSYCMTWNGKDETGESVASGFYIYNLKTGSVSKSKSMIFLK